MSDRPPRDDLIRVVPGTYRIRAADGEPPIYEGHFAIFNEFIEINSIYEGHFIERIAPGAFAKTISERRDRMRCLFEHGTDPHIGKKVLGRILRLEEDDEGPAFEVALFDTDYVRELLPPLRTGDYGTSFRFKIMQEDYVARPRRSAHNPDGLPERTYTELQVWEFGPVTFPAYVGATSGVRSLTDEFMLQRLAEDPDKLEELLARRDKPRFKCARGQSEPPSGTVRIEADSRRVGDSTDDARTLKALTEAGYTPESVRAAVLADDMALLKRDTRRLGADIGETRLYQRSGEAVGSAVWAIHPPALATILQILGERQSGYRPTQEEIRERIGARQIPEEPEPENRSTPHVAVIPILGPIFPRANLMTEMSGATSIQMAQRAFREALADPDVAAILFDIDSPGGVVDLVPEFASEILAARGTKPLIASANTFVASAAYWIASACDEIAASPSAELGSIGVYTAHEDISKLLEMEGTKVTLIVAEESPYKVEGNPFEPLSEEAEAEFKRKVDAYADMFVAAVAKGRGVKRGDVEENYGQGRTVLAAEAVERGMADRVETFDATLARLEKQAAQQARSQPIDAPETSEPEPSAATTRDRPEPDPSAGTTQKRRPKPLYGAQPEEEPRWRL
jgi:capsid assembly protease